jgi:hypothetical protein
MTSAKSFRESCNIEDTDFIETEVCSAIDRMMEEYVKVILTEYTLFLVKNGYCDSDVYDNPPSSIDRFMHPKLNK